MTKLDSESRRERGDDMQQWTRAEIQPTVVGS